MNNKLLITLVVAVLMSPVLAAQISPYTSVIPVIDGEFGEGEWDDAWHDSFYFIPSSEHPNGNIHAYVKNDGSYLYVFLDVTPDNTEDDDDYGAVWIDADNDGEYDSLEYLYGWYENNPNMAHGFTTTPNDNDNGAGENHRTWEFAISLDDYGMMPGDTIGLLFGGYGTLSPEWIYPEGADEWDARQYADFTLSTPFSRPSHHWEYPAYNIFDTATGDLNGDGKNDIGAVSEEGTFYSIGSDETLIWKEPDYSGYRTAIGDINNDGANEIIYGHYGWFSPGDNWGDYLVATDMSGNLLWYHQTDCMITDVEISDITGDGANEVLAGDSCGPDTLYVMNGAYAGNEESGFSLPEEHILDIIWEPVSDIDSEDLNGDGVNDIAIVDVGGRTLHLFTWVNEEVGGGHLDEFFSYPIGAVTVDIGDLDGDGDNEVVAGSYYNDGKGCSVMAFDNLEEGWGRAWQEYVDSCSVVDVVAGNIDGGDEEEVLAITSGAMTTYVFAGDGTQLYTKEHNGYYFWPSQNGAYGEADLLQIGDIDGDGANEWVVGASDGHIYVYRGIAPLWEYDTGSGITDVELGDINGDGIADVVAANTRSSVHVFAPPAPKTIFIDEIDEAATLTVNGVAASAGDSFTYDDSTIVTFVTAFNSRTYTDEIELRKTIHVSVRADSADTDSDDAYYELDEEGYSAYDIFVIEGKGEGTLYIDTDDWYESVQLTGLHASNIGDIYLNDNEEWQDLIIYGTAEFRTESHDTTYIDDDYGHFFANKLVAEGSVQASRMFFVQEAEVNGNFRYEDSKAITIMRLEMNNGYFFSDDNWDEFHLNVVSPMNRYYTPVDEEGNEEPDVYFRDDEMFWPKLRDPARYAFAPAWLINTNGNYYESCGYELECLRNNAFYVATDEDEYEHAVLYDTVLASSFIWYGDTDAGGSEDFNIVGPYIEADEFLVDEYGEDDYTYIVFGFDDYPRDSDNWGVFNYGDGGSFDTFTSDAGLNYLDEYYSFDGNLGNGNYYEGERNDNADGGYYSPFLVFHLGKGHFGISNYEYGGAYFYLADRQDVLFMSGGENPEWGNELWFDGDDETEWYFDIPEGSHIVLEDSVSVYDGTSSSYANSDEFDFENINRDIYFLSDSVHIYVDGNDVRAEAQDNYNGDGSAAYVSYRPAGDYGMPFTRQDLRWDEEAEKWTGELALDLENNTYQFYVVSVQDRGYFGVAKEFILNEFSSWIYGPAKVVNGGTISFFTDMNEIDDNSVDEVYIIAKDANGNEAGRFYLDETGSWSQEAAVDLPDGTYDMFIESADAAGNGYVQMPLGSFEVTPSGADDSTMDTGLSGDADNPITMSSGSGNIEIEIHLKDGEVLNGAAVISEYSKNPAASFSIPELGRFAEIEVTQDILDNLDYIIIKMHYTDAEVAAAGIDEAAMRLHYFNEATGTWEAFDPPDGGVDTSANYVWAKSTHLSMWGGFGPAPAVAAAAPEPSPASSGGCILGYSLSMPDMTAAPGSPLTMTVTVSNTGSCGLGAGAVTVTGPAGWGSGSATTNYLGLGDSQSITVTLNVPADATGANTITASSGLSGQSRSASATATVPAPPAPAGPVPAGGAGEGGAPAPTAPPAPGGGITGGITGFVAANTAPIAAAVIVVIAGAGYVFYRRRKL